ncbi:MAG TPA: hypothetical protein VMY42_08420 [Thermoguttaceae bacterium]|nr:hypothetical protein [Thermoguttaceae bacterium]
MTLTKKDLQDFHRFADAKLTSGAAGSLIDLVREWESTRQYDGSVSALRESHADVEAGRVKPLDKAFSDVREKLGPVE